MKHIRIITIAVLIGMLLPQFSFGGWLDPTFTKRMSFTIDNTKVGETLTDFTVLVDLSDFVALHSNIQDDFDDLRFTGSDGETPLNFEFVTGSTTAETGEAHPQFSSISSSADTTGYIYLSSSTAGSISSSSAWNSTYERVYHLGEAGDGTPDEFEDSTVNAGGASVSASDPASVAGKLGNAQQFDGDDTITSDATSTDFSFTTNDLYTLQFWTNDDDFSVVSAKVANAQARATANYWVQNNGQKLRWQYRNSVDSAWNQIDTDAIVFATSTWHKVDIALKFTSSTSAVVYVDGSSVAYTWSSGGTGVPAAANGPLDIGQYYGGGIATETIDEVRIVRAILSANWIAAEYANQNSPSTFYSVGNIREQDDIKGIKMGLNF